MIQIIETNLMLKENLITDHQSRIVEAESWDVYIKEFEEYKGQPLNFASLTYLEGSSVERGMHIENLEYDSYHMSCTVVNKMGWKSKKLAYLTEIKTNKIGQSLSDQSS